jgi:hypothetical protein
VIEPVFRVLHTRCCEPRRKRLARPQAPIGRKRHDRYVDGRFPELTEDLTGNGRWSVRHSHDEAVQVGRDFDGPGRLLTIHRDRLDEPSCHLQVGATAQQIAAGRHSGITKFDSLVD